mgnify:CR=1 FL=1
MGASILYRERLLPSPVTSLVLVAVVAMFAIAAGAPLGAPAGWLTFAILGAVALSMIWWTTPQITVTDDVLRVGNATLPRTSIAAVTPLDAAQARIARGPGADARTYVALRTWATQRAVLVQVDDEADPHPAWLFSSRHPDAVARALQ